MRNPEHNTERRKSEKFGILDSPSIRREDLRAPAGPRGVALLYLDIDNFKRLNTKYKETLVDQTLLPAFQKLIRDLVQDHGLAYAEGGDEVVILLKNCSSLVAAAFAEEVRMTIEKATFQIKQDMVGITVSIGIAHSGDHEDGEDLQLEANKAKDISKNNGRNKCSIALRGAIMPVAPMSPIVFSHSPHPLVSPARLKEMAEEEEEVITSYICRTPPFYQEFYCAGQWKRNQCVELLPDELRVQLDSRVRSSADRIPRVRRSIVIMKALDGRGQPCILHYFSSRPIDGWMTWLLPNVDRDAAHKREDFLTGMADDLRTFLAITSEKILIHDLHTLSVCLKTNRHAPQPNLRVEPKFYALRYYYATVTSLPQHLLQRECAIRQGSFNRSLRWFYSEELAQADDGKIIQANADVVKTIWDTCTTLLTTVPEACPGSRLLD